MLNKDFKILIILLENFVMFFFLNYMINYKYYKTSKHSLKFTFFHKLMMILKHI